LERWLVFHKRLKFPGKKEVRGEGCPSERILVVICPDESQRAEAEPSLVVFARSEVTPERNVRERKRAFWASFDQLSALGRKGERMCFWPLN
jgi:hypothetical protein